ncbi:MAG: GNAT family N-acetyltransferase [Chloroflexi bacterium]|nr:GNAT family N-acetyltransferase [Chloroflexota bacterium]
MKNRTRMETELPVIKLRPVVVDDFEILWRWRNDPENRKQAVSPEFIPRSHHRLWCITAMNSGNPRVYVIEDVDENPVGEIRLQDNQDGSIELSLGIGPDFRRKGFGTAAIIKACSIAENEGFEKVLAYIRIENEISVRTFKKAGFSFVKELDFNGANSLEVEWKPGSGGA